MKSNNVNKITILNILSTFILQGLVFIMTPIFTRLLGTSQFGVYSLFNSWVIIMTCLMGFSMHSSIGTGLYTFKSDYISFRNSTLFFSTLICFVELLITAILYKPLSIVLNFEPLIIPIIGVTAFAHYIVNFAQNVFIYEKKAWANFFLTVGISVSTVLLSVSLIHIMKSTEKYWGRILGVMLPYVIIAAFVWSVLFVKKPVFLNKKYNIYAFQVGFPIVFHALSQNILGQSDRVMMQMFGISMSEIGIYSLFYSLCAVMSTILTALNNSWCPFYYDDISEKKWNSINLKSKHYIELFSVLTVGFLLLSREVSYVMGDESYWSGIDVIPILVCAVYFTFMYQFPVNFEFFHKKTNIIAAGTVGAGVLNVILNWFMIPIYGMYGAAVATALSYFALFLVHFYMVNKMKEYDYRLSITNFLPCFVMVILAAMTFYLMSSWWYVRWGIGIVIGVIELVRIIKRKSIF